MDSTNSSQQSYPGDYASLPNLTYNNMEETSTATECGAVSQARGDEDEEKEKDNSERDASNEIPEGYLLDEIDENLPMGSFDSWMNVNEAFLEAQVVDNSAGPATTSSIADERLRAFLRARAMAMAMRGPGRPGELELAVDGESIVSAAAMPGDAWGDGSVLDCSDEVWDQILGEDAVDGSAIWGDGQAMGNVGAEEDTKS
ncbi:hypothetical protein E4U21_006195 [Claviceps maximensis]|nr:hypothetical protein E4U21_006195 [Claviceps maximensis]